MYQAGLGAFENINRMMPTRRTTAPIMAAIQSNGPNTAWLVSLVNISNTLCITEPSDMKRPIKSTIRPARKVIGLPVFSGSTVGVSKSPFLSFLGILPPEELYSDYDL
jgi:hypothetical protein